MAEAPMVHTTPGPWGWFGCQHGFYLATKHSGRRYVMDFVRQGMRGAQPRFQIRGIMHDAAELVQFAVGDKSVRGLKAGKAHESVYRYDITAIDHPDARLIAAAPDLLANERELHRLSLVIESAVRNSDPGNHAAVLSLLRANRAALKLIDPPVVVNADA